MVVDDDDAVRRGFLRGFAAAGKRVAAAADSVAARQSAKDLRPDLAVVDLRLGRDWGIDLISDLKAAVPDLTVALVSAWVGTQAAVTAMQAGAEHVFIKPVTCSRILDEVETGRTADPADHSLPSLATVEWDHLMRAVTESKWNISEAARRLGIPRSSLQKRLKKSHGRER